LEEAYRHVWGSDAERALAYDFGLSMPEGSEGFVRLQQWCEQEMRKYREDMLREERSRS